MWVWLNFILFLDKCSWFGYQFRDKQCNMSIRQVREISGQHLCNQYPLMKLHESSFSPCTCNLHDRPPINYCDRNQLENSCWKRTRNPSWTWRYGNPSWQLCHGYWWNWGLLWKLKRELLSNGSNMILK